MALLLQLLRAARSGAGRFVLCGIALAAGAPALATDLSLDPHRARSPLPSDPSPVDFLIIAPHPDDDTITAAGITMRARDAGQSVRIVYMTNGDFSAGTEQGLLREAEAVTAAVDHLGMSENDLVFLGYPDAYLRQIDQSYPNVGDMLVAPWGQSVTYADRGLGGTDYHSYRFGSPAAYNRANILADLQDILSSLKPRHIFLPSEWDKHSDHATTYALLSAALASVHSGDPAYVPTVHKTIVWADDLNDPIVWPELLDPGEYHVEVPDLSDTDLDWAGRESIDVPLAMQETLLGENPKYLAIASISSQGGTAGFLGRFIHRDEFFWVENQTGANHPPRVSAGASQTVSEGVTVHLDGTGSSDADGPAPTLHWVQTSGTPVTLSDDASTTPAFVAPTGLPEDDWLQFELTVTDGELTSIPDFVFVKVIAALPIAPTNVAPAASVSASTENPADHQEAVKAVDGVADGWPGDYTREWATLGESAGAWLQLDWGRPYSIDRIILHDRPNTDDGILAGTLTFSDATSLSVGPLDDSGGGVATSFAPKLLTSLRFTVDATTSTTVNVGLAEILALRTQSPDWDGDDWTLADGDCNDADAAVHPGAPDATCDGIDNNCNGTADEGYVSQPTTCGGGACGATGATSCVDGHVVDGCVPGSPTVEACDGIDNDCDGAIDDVAAPSGAPALVVGRSRLEWTALTAATAYDVVRGGLGELRSSGGSFASSTLDCVANDLSAVALDSAVDPTAGSGFWLLVRGTNCGGAGSFDEPAGSQSGNRDPGIAASGAACP